MTLIAKLAITDLILVVTFLMAAGIIVPGSGPKTLLEKVIFGALIVSLIMLPILAIIAVWISTPNI